jgi:nucleoid DNA-binding protein
VTSLETVRQISAELDLSQAEVRRVLLAAAALAERTLAKGEKVALPGIGSIEPQWRKPRVVRSIADARKTYVGGKYVARFLPATPLREALERRAPDHWRTPEHQSAWRLAETLVADLALYHGASAPSAVPEAELEARCAAAFGDLWTRARAEWSSRVPAEVTEQQDYLAQAALARWGA